MTNIELPPPEAEHNEQYDGVIAAPNSHHVIFEDDSRRELVVLLPPGAREPFHLHAKRSEMRVFRSALLRYYYADGRSEDIPKKAVTPDNPLVEQLEPEPLHSVENLSETDTYYALRIEFKD